MYFLGTDDNKIYYETPLPMSGNEDPSEGGSLPSGLGTFDIARQGDPNSRVTPGDLWAATDHPDSPIRAYNPSGVLTYASDVLDDCRGMAFGPLGGTDYLWVSHPGEGSIYQLAVPETGVAGSGRARAGQMPLTASSNPFRGSVTLSWSGDCRGAVLEVFDLSGRRVFAAPFDGSADWSGAAAAGRPLPAGVYVARVRNHMGETAAIRLTRL